MPPRFHPRPRRRRLEVAPPHATVPYTPCSSRSALLSLFLLPAFLILLYLLSANSKSFDVPSITTLASKWKQEKLFTLRGHGVVEEREEALSPVTPPLPPPPSPPRPPHPCPWSTLDWAHPESLITWSAHRNLSTRDYTRDGELRLHIQGCDLSWVTPAKARSCMASPKVGHLLVVGDSISRFLYISLTHFLHTGSWDPAPRELPLDAPRWWIDYSVEEPRLDLDGYLKATGERMGGYEVCDCFIDADVHLENRFYEEAGVKVTYATFFSHRHPVYLHSPHWLNASCGTPPCIQGGCSIPQCNPTTSPPQHTLKLGRGEDITAWPHLVSPDTVVFNVGLHDPLVGEEDLAAMQTLVRDMAEVVKVGRGGDLRGDWDQYTSSSSSKQQGGAAVVGGGGVSGGGGRGGGNSRGNGNPPTRNPSHPHPFIWRTTTPRRWFLNYTFPAPADISPKDAQGKGVSHHLVNGGSPAAPPKPWPKFSYHDEHSLKTVVNEGGRVFDAFALTWPLLILAREAGGSSSPYTHPDDSLHFAPGVNAELNRALLSMLCEGWLEEEGGVGGGGG